MGSISRQESWQGLKRRGLGVCFDYEANRDCFDWEKDQQKHRAPSARYGELVVYYGGENAEQMLATNAGRSVSKAFPGDFPDVPLHEVCHWPILPTPMAGYYRLLLPVQHSYFLSREDRLEMLRRIKGGPWQLAPILVTLNALLMMQGYEVDARHHLPMNAKYACGEQLPNGDSLFLEYNSHTFSLKTCNTSYHAESVAAQYLGA